MLLSKVHATSLLGAGWVAAWVVPALLAVLVIGAIWIGVRWAYSADLASLGTPSCRANISVRWPGPHGASSTRPERR
jgi:hypothetical protein